jgi:hypothetical protein
MEMPMTSRQVRQLSLVLALAALVPVPLSADNQQGNNHQRPCSEGTLRGTYGIQMHGTRPSGPGGLMETVVGVVIRDYDGEGQFTQVDNAKGSISGWVPDREGSGTYEVNADCTGKTHFQPGPGVTIEERFVIVDKGREVLSMVSSPPPVLITTIQLKIDRP